MNSKLSLLLYGIAAFLVFMVLTWLLKLAGEKLPVKDGFLGVYRQQDYIIGIVIAIVLTFSHAQKRKLKK